MARSAWRPVDFARPIRAPLPGERERPCEIVTPPIASDHRAALTTFGSSSFAYCGAKMIGACFNHDACLGQVFIGTKIRAGSIGNVRWFPGRTGEGGNKCPSGEVPYNCAAAARLAGLRGKNDSETKTAIANPVTIGSSDVVGVGLG